MLVGHFPGAYAGIEMIHPGHVHMTQVLEQVSAGFAVHPKRLLMQQVAGEHDLVFVAPISDLLIVSVVVLLRKGVPEIVADFFCILPDIEKEFG